MKYQESITVNGKLIGMVYYASYAGVWVAELGIEFEYRSQSFLTKDRAVSALINFSEDQLPKHIPL